MVCASRLLFGRSLAAAIRRGLATQRADGAAFAIARLEPGQVDLPKPDQERWFLVVAAALEPAGDVEGSQAGAGPAEVPFLPRGAVGTRGVRVAGLTIAL